MLGHAFPFFVPAAARHSRHAFSSNSTGAAKDEAKQQPGTTSLLSKPAAASREARCCVLTFAVVRSILCD
jgi:hypothetical protein